MNRLPAPRLFGLVLAAGFSTRMGRDKALLPWPPEPGAGDTLLSAALRALAPITDEVIVVAGHNAASLAPVVSTHAAWLVRNPAPEAGQFSSLRIGLRALLGRGGDAAAITPVDCPPLSLGSLEALRSAFAGAVAGGAWALTPARGPRHGHPLFASRPLIQAFLAAPPEGNARAVQHAYAARIDRLQVVDDMLGIDLNSPDEYGRAPSARSPASR